MCPICTVTVVAGLGISRMLGIDDLITSLWIGGFILSFTFITNDWIKRKWPKIDSNYYYYPMFALMYLFVLIPFKMNGTIGIAKNTFWGIDKIILGIAIGSVVFIIGALADKLQRKRFKKIFFPFQKVIFPVVALLITSVIFWFATK
jgi:hypothetical protein